MTFGGVDVKQQPTDTVEIYDVQKKDWQGESDKIDPMREKVLGLSAVLRGICTVLMCIYRLEFVKSFILCEG